VGFCFGWGIPVLSSFIKEATFLRRQAASWDSERQPISYLLSYFLARYAHSSLFILSNYYKILCVFIKYSLLFIHQITFIIHVFFIFPWKWLIFWKYLFLAVIFGALHLVAENYHHFRWLNIIGRKPPKVRENPTKNSCFSCFWFDFNEHFLDLAHAVVP
jgi:riboflavin transporter FmnP